MSQFSLGDVARRQQTTIPLRSPVENVDWTGGVHYRVDARLSLQIVEFPAGVETAVDPKTRHLRTTHEINISWGVSPTPRPETDEERRRREVSTITSYTYDNLRAKLTSMSIEEAAADLGASVALIEEYRGRLGIADWRQR